MKKGEPQKALDAWLEGLEIALLIGNSSLQAMLGGNIEAAYLMRGNLVEAADYFDRALQWAEIGGSPESARQYPPQPCRDPDEEREVDGGCRRV